MKKKCPRCGWEYSPDLQEKPSHALVITPIHKRQGSIGEINPPTCSGSGMTPKDVVTTRETKRETTRETTKDAGTRGSIHERMDEENKE